MNPVSGVSERPLFLNCEVSVRRNFRFTGDFSND